MNPRKRAANRAAMSIKDKEQFGKGWISNGGCSYFDRLPQAIVMEVLVRVSFKTLFNCRCVCKDWLSIISDPQFDRLRQSTSPVIILIKSLGRKPDLILIKSLVEECVDSDLWIERMKSTNSIAPISEFKLVNSCNGLICLSGEPTSTRYSPLYVWNPILGEFIIIPPAPKASWGSFFGFGFSVATNEYKVLHTSISLSAIKAEAEAEIYTIGSPGWRSIGSAPMEFPELPFNAYLHGAVHWLSYCGTMSKLINTFNFETEQFRRLPSPSCFGHRKKQSSESFQVGVLGGCLFLSVYLEKSTKMDMWVMKDYGVQESWAKTLVFENLFPTTFFCGFYEPIMVLSNGEILMVYNNLDVVCYSPKLKSFGNIRITETGFSLNAIAYSPSFVSLSDISMGERFIRRERNSSRSNKLLAEGHSGHAGSGMRCHRVHET